MPFSFTAKGQTYPAGTYTVAMDQTENIVNMSNNTDASKHLAWVAGPAEPVGCVAVIKFDEVGTDHALRTIQVGDHITPNLDRGHKAIAATTSISGE